MHQGDRARHARVNGRDDGRAHGGARVRDRDGGRAHDGDDSFVFLLRCD